eukprot:2775430-Alexandrium_andersonii.AAC.1
MRAPLPEGSAAVAGTARSSARGDSQPAGRACARGVCGKVRNDSGNDFGPEREGAVGEGNPA